MSITMIPLNQLTRSPKNVRKTGLDKGIQELAKNIECVGLIHNLTVYPGKADGKFEVVAGDRRLRAMQLLVKQKLLPADHPVECKVVTEHAAEDLSISENQLREQMHPVDQLEAFVERVNAGDDIADVANRFGVTEAFVKQRMKLYNVAPQLLEACRAGDMSLAQLQAFSVTDDHARQVDLWEEIKDLPKEWQTDPDEIKSTLLEEAVSARDYRLTFVGKAAYQKAGGALLKPDLFAEGDQDGEIISDTDLLDRLVMEKLQRQANKLKKSEGLAFVDVLTGTSHFSPGVGDASAYAKASTYHLEQKIEDLCKQQDTAQEEENYELFDSLCEQERELDDQLDAIRDSLTLEHHPDEVEHIGAVICLHSYSSKPAVYRNIIYRQHRAKSQGKTGSAEFNSSGDEAPKAKYSEKLLRDMSAHKTAILRSAIVGLGGSALITLIYDMLVDQYGDQLGVYNRCLTMSKDWKHSYVQVESSASKLFDQKERQLIEPISAMMKGDAGDADDHQVLYDYIAGMNLGSQLELLSLLVANRVDLVSGNINAPGHSEILVNRYLSDEQIAKHWRPYRDTFLGSVSKPVIMDALAEACGQDEANKLATMKKGEAIDHAEPLLVESNWLPAPMRAGE